MEKDQGGGFLECVCKEGGKLHASIVPGPGATLPYLKWHGQIRARTESVTYKKPGRNPFVQDLITTDVIFI